MARVTRPGGLVAAYVWDYAEGMQLMRRLWDAAVALDPAARALDEGQRFSMTDPKALRAHFEGAGLQGVEVRAIDIATVFRDFDDYWMPFLAGQGPAGAYVAGLEDSGREALRARLQTTLAAAADGSIHLDARAWAVRGSV
jgi:hypothetical protein